MTALPPVDLLPVLVADLADEQAHEVLEAAAFTGSQVYVPLDAAPVNTSTHVLEVHVPGMEDPVYFLAHPLGPPTHDGFPLRVAPMPDAKAGGAVPSSAPAPSGVVRTRQSSAAITLTASHTADLSQAAQAPRALEDNVLGRALAGGKLVMETLIGRGGVGAVYKARHRELRIPVAVKVLHESFQHDIDFCRRFYAEALAASRLDHANVTRVIDFGQEPDGLLYLAMEFLAGVELRALLDKETVLPALRIAELMMQTCAGLSHAHARGIVHRDIKPENLVIVPFTDDDGERIELVKVCDFGIAQHRALPDAEEEGLIAGTPEYMSPEQCRGDALDARSDVYACGVVLYELATGQVPFTSDRPQAILDKHQFTAPLPPTLVRPGVDPTLEQIILGALSKDPDDRPQSMRELRASLREVLAPSARDVSGPPSSRRSLGRAMATGEVSRATVPAPSPSPPISRAMLVVPSSVRAGPQELSPEWLERDPAQPPPSLRKQPAAVVSLGPVMDTVADALVHNAATWLYRLTSTVDPQAFALLARKLEPAIRSLAASGETGALWAVSSALHGIAMEGTQAVGTRAHVAASLLRLFDDPAILSTVAEHLLRGSEEARENAKRLLVNAGVSGAYGLYGARVKLASEHAIRGVFTTVLRDFGPKAWPVVRAALEKIIATDQSQNPRAMELAEDLLLSVPVVGDEAAGHLVVKYLRVNVSGVCRAATASIVKMWAERAKPLLIGMLQSKDDSVRIAGIAGLRQLEAIDEHVVPRLQTLLLRRLPASEELRAVAATALSHAVPSARQSAIAVLTQLLTPAHGASADPRRAPPSSQLLSREDAVMLAAARSLLALGGPSQRNVIATRADESPEPLRTQLKKLLAAAA